MSILSSAPAMAQDFQNILATATGNAASAYERAFVSRMTRRHDLLGRSAELTVDEYNRLTALAARQAVRQPAGAADPILSAQAQS